ncbi:DUF3552 domain-containing protein, partial [Candidatus Parcubacteria bacterium]|nr:DUF3552 domain-containing protein [Candidatus Parcubacteria bacterium]
MMLTLYLAIGIFTGITVGYLARRTIAVKQGDIAETKAKNVLYLAEEKEKKILLSARDKSLKIIDEAKKEEQARREDLSRIGNRLEKREALFDKKILEIENKEDKIRQEAQNIVKFKEELKKVRKEQIKKLEKIATLTKERAKTIMMDLVEKETEQDLA